MGQHIGTDAFEFALLVDERQRQVLIVDRHFNARMLVEPLLLTVAEVEPPMAGYLRPFRAPAAQDGHAFTGRDRRHRRIHHAQ